LLSLFPNIWEQPSQTKIYIAKSIIWITPKQIFTQTGEKIRKLRVDINFSPEVQLTSAALIFMKFKPSQQLLYRTSIPNFTRILRVVSRWC